MQSMHTEKIIYTHENEKLIGFAAYEDKIKARRPVVMVAHAWYGQDDFARNKAIELAKLGYLGFAIDMFGNGKNPSNNEEAGNLIAPFFKDRKKMQGRIGAALECIKKHPLADAQKIGAIGFCFGGLCVIELVRSGADVRGGVSFHGVLGYQMGEMKAKAIPIAKNIHASLLILHGNDDPLVTQLDILHMQRELTDAKVDWQMHIYGHTSHAFTNPQANDPSMGLKYQPKAAKRSWQSMVDFFQEIFP